MNKDQRERLEEIKARVDWQELIDPSILPYSLKVEQRVIDRMQQDGGYKDVDEHLRSLALIVREKLLPTVLHGNSQGSDVVSLQLRMDKPYRGTLQFLAADEAFYLSDEELLPEAGQPEQNLLAVPVLDRGNGPPIDVDTLKAEVREMIAGGVDLSYCNFVSGQSINVVIEFRDYDGDKHKAAVTAVLENFVREGADRIVMVAEAVFKDRDGMPTWGGVLIHEATKDGEVIHTAPFEGKHGLGEWTSRLPGPDERLGLWGETERVKHVGLASKQVADCVGPDGVEEVAKEVSNVLNRLHALGVDRESVAFFERHGMKLVAVTRFDKVEDMLKTEIYPLDECGRVSRFLGQRVLASLTPEQRATATLAEGDSADVSGVQCAPVILAGYEVVSFHRSALEPRSGSVGPTETA